MEDVGLLPETAEDFRSQTFWDGFFKARGATPFEWYGEWRQLRPIAGAICRGQRILMAGCGNSEISANMYDDGCEEMVNIDFSSVVVREMMMKHLRLRPRMKWQVMDMTATSFPARSFGVVFDKGGLDALMGEDDTGAGEAGLKFLLEVSRLIQEGGTYICVTLAQQHVLRTLLAAFGTGWNVTLHKVPPTPDMAGASLQPIVTVVQRLFSGRPGEAAAVHLPPPVQLAFKHSGRGPDAAQVSEIVQIVEAENVSRTSGHTLPPQTLAPQQHPVPDAAYFLDLHPGMRTELVLPLHKASQPPSTKNSGALVGRFDAVVLDAAEDMSHAAIQECSVFIVPQGREHEWMFAAEEGQWQVAESCRSQRVIIISLRRGEAYSSLNAIKAELSPAVLQLAPLASRTAPRSIPFQSLAEGAGHRTLVAQAHSALSGDIVVEDVERSLDDGSGGVQVLRRMVFLGSRNLIQSEAVLRRQHPASLKGKISSAGGGGTQEPAMEVDHSQLPCGYHTAIVAGLALIGPALTAATADGRRGAALVVGLGGGGLPVFLAHSCGLAVEAVELDPAVVTLARAHFGFADSSDLTARVGDGLVAAVDRAAAVKSGQAPSLQLLVVDASSGDATQAMSCPPAAFLESSFLQAARDALSPGGMLVFNCVSRSKKALASALASLQRHFAEVHMQDMEEDVNCVLFALKTASKSCTATGLQARLDSIATADGPLMEELQDMLSSMRVVDASDGSE